MKKILLTFLSLMGVGFPAFAQSHINIELLSATYTAPAVQFRVSWDAIPEGACHNSKIWLWVDFVKIENNQPSGTWTRATVATATPEASVSYDGNNRQGFWLQGNDGNYDQIVTVALANIPANTTFNWCAYTSDCPPFVIANNGTYTLQGTPPFILKAADGTIQEVEGNTLPASSLTIAAVTLTDKTACPSFFCAYTGSDLFRNDMHLCGHRTSGAKKWEAYIKDSRDNQIYRITQFSDNTWWFADDFNIDENVKSTCGGKRYYSTKNNPSCPPNWSVPTTVQIKNRWIPLPDADEYGGRIEKGNAPYQDHECYVDHDGRYDILVTDCDPDGALGRSKDFLWYCNAFPDVWGRMRCFRQL
ncbi:MAG: hypothetical protein LBF81_03805 [Prevotellaceae bacterium]|nr:hypothetical protein [Prevotellaceae bacterium]